jgi:transposase
MWDILVMEKTRAKLPTLRQFQERFPTEDACLEHLKLVRYGAKHTCAKCDREARYYRVKARRSYECEHCGYQVYPTAGTPFHGTRTSLRDWFHVMFLFCASRNGVSAKEIQRTIGVTYKTAWRMARLVREYMGYVDGDMPLGGPDGKTVEIDHTFVGGYDKKGENDKKIVLGMVETDGNVIARSVPDLKGTTNIQAIKATVKPGSRITSDAGHAFGGLSFVGMSYDHLVLNHRAGERSKGYRSTNTIEGFWNLVKRGINGTYISVSQKHIDTYLGEFQFRYNLRKEAHLMLPLLLTSFPRP